MANHKSAVKRARQALRKRNVNTKTKSNVKTFEKKVLTAIKEKNKDLALQLLKEYTAKLAKAAQKGVVHLKHASRKISRLSEQVSAAFK